MKKGPGVLETVRYVSGDQMEIDVRGEFYHPPPASWEVWKPFVSKVTELTGLTEDEIIVVGSLAGNLVNGECSISGEYPTGIIHIVRNVFYNLMTSGGRWRALEGKPMPGPILEYGGGAGFNAAYVAHRSGEQVYYYEPPSTQQKFAMSVLPEFGVKEWNGEPVGTVLMYNVLEHLHNPEEVLDRLEGLSQHIYATLDYTTGDTTDVITPERARNVLRRLHAKGQLVAADGSANNEICPVYRFLYEESKK